ncbi:MAG: ABC transporter ATP-binding protein [Bacillota bacterium]|nr:ABC transporter ATP-binding protein [Bacillota bacterium]
MAERIIEVKDLTKTYRVPSARLLEKKKLFTAVNAVNFYVEKGETVGLIGESGCGKTTVGRIITKLLDCDGGQVIFEGEDITRVSRRAFKEKRSKIQMIFQDPSTALNPQFTIGGILREALHSIGVRDKGEQKARIDALISKVGMTDEYLERYPHELSGGQKQRICILIALLTNPSFIVADEVVSALDLSVQAQILNLMRSLQKEFELSTLFISHDLNIIHYMSDRIIVMYMGEIVESGECQEIYSRGRHPYTQLLLSSLLDLNADNTSGEARDSGDVIRGDSVCIFAPRCPNCTEKCLREKPELKEIGERHWVKCHYVE